MSPGRGQGYPCRGGITLPSLPRWGSGGLSHSLEDEERE